MRKYWIGIIAAVLIAGALFFYINRASDGDKDIVLPDSSEVSSEAESNENEEISSETDSTESEEVSENPSESEAQQEPATEENISEITDSEDSYEDFDLPVKNYDNVVTVGNVCYEKYAYLPKRAEAYTSLINGVASELKGFTDVYSVIAPTSVGITFPKSYMEKAGVSDMSGAMNALYEGLSEDVNTVKIYDSLKEHSDEYLYFRTDHHWTARGAYYAYNEFCKAKGFVPHDISEYRKVDYDGFLGSFYKYLDETADTAEICDTVEAYYPVNEDNMNLRFTTIEGVTYNWPVITNGDTYPAAGKYNIFAASDNPYTVINNGNITDGSSCVVVKESFGNAFVPFVADHYSTVYEIDYRYWDGNLIDFIYDNNIDDVIFLNNVSMIRSGYLINKLAEIL